VAESIQSITILGTGLIGSSVGLPLCDVALYQGTTWLRRNAALYQGTTSVVPHVRLNSRGFSR
jgi:hypothetical protein